MPMTGLKNRFARSRSGLLLLVLFTLVGTAQAESDLHWKQTDGSTTLMQGDELVWQFNYAGDCTKPYFHPVNLPGVGTLTWDSPPDHPWHYALWFSWKYIGGVNYWEESRETGSPAGITAWDDVQVKTGADGSARFEIDLSYHPSEAEAVMTEHRVIEVSPLAKNGAYHFDWVCTFTATDADVLLDRTPLPDEPDGKVFGGYAGLSVRLGKDFVDWRAVDSDGQITEQAERIRVKARAVDYSGTLDGKPAGIAIADHPSNLNAPTPWYIIQTPAKPMGYFSPAVIQRSPHTLPAGESMTLRYRVFVHPGRWSAKRLAGQADRFSK